MPALPTHRREPFATAGVLALARQGVIGLDLAVARAQDHVQSRMLRVFAGLLDDSGEAQHVACDVLVVVAVDVVRVHRRRGNVVEGNAGGLLRQAAVFAASGRSLTHVLVQVSGHAVSEPSSVS